MVPKYAVDVEQSRSPNLNQYLVVLPGVGSGWTIFFEKPSHLDKFWLITTAEPQGVEVIDFCFNN